MDEERESRFRRLDKAFDSARLYVVLALVLLVLAELLIGYGVTSGGFHVGRMLWLKLAEFLLLIAALASARIMAGITDLRGRRGVWEDDSPDAGSANIGAFLLWQWWLAAHASFWLGVVIAWLTVSIPP